MIVRIPRRPDVEDKTARRVLDWVDTAAYIFWVLFLITLAILALVNGASHVDLTSLRLR